MDTNIIIQYTIVGIIILAVIVWILVKFLKKNKRSGSCCCTDCGLSEKCTNNKAKFPQNKNSE